MSQALIAHSSGSGELSKGYSAGQIISKKYLASDLEDEAKLRQDLAAILAIYDELSGIAGDSVLNIDPSTIAANTNVTDIERRVNQATLEPDVGVALKNLVTYAESQPPRIKERLVRQIERNPKFARYVKRRANYICELCGREPFIQKSGKPYAEAHHVESLEDRGRDHPDNMQCVCAQCHAILTHGSEQEITRLQEPKK